MALGKDTLTVYLVWAGAELAGTDAALALRQFDDLIRNHMLGRTAPHPLQAGLPDEPQTSAEYPVHIHGRNCSFASFDEPIAAPNFETRKQAVP